MNEFLKSAEREFDEEYLWAMRKVGDGRKEHMKSFFNRWLSKAWDDGAMYEATEHVKKDMDAFEAGKREGREEERERCRQIAHYWSIEVVPEISAQADINVDDVDIFRVGCRFVEDEIKKGN